MKPFKKYPVKIGKNRKIYLSIIILNNWLYLCLYFLLCTCQKYIKYQTFPEDLSKMVYVINR